MARYKTTYPERKMSKVSSSQYRGRRRSLTLTDLERLRQSKIREDQTLCVANNTTRRVVCHRRQNAFFFGIAKPKELRQVPFRSSSPANVLQTNIATGYQRRTCFANRVGVAHSSANQVVYDLLNDSMSCFEDTNLDCPTGSKELSSSSNRCVQFCKYVAVQTIPNRESYSSVERSDMWTDRYSMKKMVRRNNEEYRWEISCFHGQVLEEKYFRKVGSSLIHPAHIKKARRSQSLVGLN
jgi:hypothetical protein